MKKPSEVIKEEQKILGGLILALFLPGIQFLSYLLLVFLPTAHYNKTIKRYMEETTDEGDLKEYREIMATNKTVTTVFAWVGGIIICVLFVCMLPFYLMAFSSWFN